MLHKYIFKHECVEAAKNGKPFIQLTPQTIIFLFHYIE